MVAMTRLTAGFMGTVTETRAARGVKRATAVERRVRPDQNRPGRAEQPLVVRTASATSRAAPREDPVESRSCWATITGALVSVANGRSAGLVGRSTALSPRTPE